MFDDGEMKHSGEKVLKKAPLHVVDEDDYVEGLSNVIARDFFPELKALHDQDDEVEGRKRGRLDGSTVSGVDAFLGTFTSEDNASFLLIQEEEKKRRVERDVWGRDRASRRRGSEAESDSAILMIGPAQGVAGLLEARSSEKLLCDRQVIAGNTRLTEEERARVERVKKVDADWEDEKRKLAEVVGKKTGRGLHSVESVLEKGAQEARVGGYTFLADTPVVVPQAKRNFKVAETPEREKILLQLADAKKKAQSSHTRSVGGPSPVFSPAGQKLLEAQLAGRTPSLFKTPIAAAKKNTHVMATPPIPSTRK